MSVLEAIISNKINENKLSNKKNIKSYYKPYDIYNGYGKTAILFENSTISYYLEELFVNLYKIYPFPEEWKNEGISPPTQDCIKQAKDIFFHLYNESNILPKRIAPSVEEAVLLFYEKGDKTLAVEIYNDSDVSAVFNQNNKIYSEDIKNNNFNTILMCFNND